ncbi:hypothetical protein E4U54_000681 [Claviceps lovelessii]|nr:hypothetical protein E4U54_000681 [Claviceps lovelessii]
MAARDLDGMVFRRRLGVQKRVQARQFAFRPIRTKTKFAVFALTEHQDPENLSRSLVYVELRPVLCVSLMSCLRMVWCQISALCGWLVVLESVGSVGSAISPFRLGWLCGRESTGMASAAD